MPDDEKKPDESDEKDPAPADEDKFRPEAIAARVDRIGDETDADRIAREEENKLLERKRQQKKAKRGLETAASKRLARIGEDNVKRPSLALGAVAPDADPLLERAARAGQWIRGHRQVFGGAVAVVALAGASFVGWTYWQDKRNGDASALLARAFADERGHIAADKDEQEEDDSKVKQLYPTFKSAAERRNAALEKYRSVEAKYAHTGAAFLARLAEASLLLDAGDAKGALGAYEDVKASPLALADMEVRGRALEGIGFADELLAQTDEGGRDKHLDDALGAFTQLEHVDVTGFKELGMYHEARVLQARGDKAKAIELLKDVQKRVSEPGDSHAFSYLEFVVEDRLRELDPTALPPKAPKMGGQGSKAGGNLDMDDPKIQELIRQMQQKGGGAPMPAPIQPR